MTAMPSPERTMRHSIAILRKNGISEGDACLIIMEITDELMVDYAHQAEQVPVWLLAIWRAASDRLERLQERTAETAAAPGGESAANVASRPQQSAGRQRL